MKKRNLFLSLICSIVLTVALVTVTIISIVPKKSTNKVPTAGNVSDNTNVSDGNNEEPVVPVEKFQDGSAEYPYIIKDVETFNRYIGGYGYTSGEEAAMVPEMVPEKVQNQVPEKVQAEEAVKVQAEEAVMVPKTVYACTPEGDIIYDENGEPTLIVVRDADGKPVMTEKLDADGNVVMGLVFDADGNPVMVDKLDENGNVVMKGVVDADGNPVMVDKIDENGNVVMIGEVDADGNPVMVEKLDADGKVVLTEKLDENGNVVMTKKLDADGNVVYITTTYFELANDIDFEGVDYTTLFNQDKPFNGVIDGKGFALKNIKIVVTKANLKSFIYKNEANSNRYDAHIAVFGTVENAEIVKMGIENISVVIADDVYPYVYDGEFAEEYGDSMNEITVATLAAVAKNSILNVNVTGEIDADAYSIYAENNVQGYNAIGGIVAVSNKTTISDSTVNVKLSTKEAVEDENKNYFVGGVAGYAYYSTIKNVEVKFEISANYEQALYMGGLVGYALDTDVENANIDLTVKETGDRKTVKAGDTINVEEYTWVAGAIAIIQADSAELATTLKNVNIVADVDIDVVYAGVVVEIWSTATEGECVKFEDVIVNSNVNTLQAYGFVRAIANKSVVAVNLSKVELDEANDAEFNVKLTGTVRLTGTPTTVVASLYSYDAIGNLANVKIVVSEAIYESIQPIEKLRKYGSVVRI